MLAIVNNLAAEARVIRHAKRAKPAWSTRKAVIEAADDPAVAAVRAFSRFYTRRIGVLDDGLLGTDLTLAEARLIDEIASGGDEVTASRLCAALGLDAGHVSRLVKALETRGLVARAPKASDARVQLITLTRAGAAKLHVFDMRSRAEIAGMIARLASTERRRLISAMRDIEALLAPDKVRSDAVIRPCRIGDMGWIIHRHGVLYAEEYGWDATFEAMVAKLCADFIMDFKPGREICLIAERDGAILGSAMVAEGGEQVAKLRVVYVEASERGTGLGRRLVEAAMQFAREAGYTHMKLWTNDVLLPARRLYEKLGFVASEREPHHSFGKDLIGETWERPL
jgi:DNA-binding MarR family transcriptional regulator/GNAT superfamily N-acetyltransferase